MADSPLPSPLARAVSEKRFVDYVVVFGHELSQPDATTTAAGDLATFIVRLQAVLLERVPVVDHSDFALAPLLKTMPDFCFMFGGSTTGNDPKLAKTSSKGLEPTFFTFAMSGGSVTVACLVVHERHRLAVADASVYVPKAFCIVSRLPYMDAFRASLTELVHAAADSRNGGHAVARRIAAQLLYEVPLPPDHSTCLRFSVGARNLGLLTPGLVCNYSFRPLLACLGVTRLQQLLMILCMEGKVVFLMRSPTDITILSAACEAARALLFPFEWVHTFIPVLPLPMWWLLECPAPFLVGIVGNLAGVQLPEDVVVFDLDKDKTVPEEPALPLIPAPLQVLRRLKQLYAWEHLPANRSFWRRFHRVDFPSSAQMGGSVQATSFVKTSVSMSKNREIEKKNSEPPRANGGDKSSDDGVLDHFQPPNGSTFSPKDENVVPHASASESVRENGTDRISHDSTGISPWRRVGHKRSSSQLSTATTCSIVSVASNDSEGLVDSLDEADSNNLTLLREQQIQQRISVAFLEVFLMLFYKYGDFHTVGASGFDEKGFLAQMRLDEDVDPQASSGVAEFLKNALRTNSWEQFLELPPTNPRVMLFKQAISLFRAWLNEPPSTRRPFGEDLRVWVARFYEPAHTIVAPSCVVRCLDQGRDSRPRSRFGRIRALEFDRIPALSCLGSFTELVCVPASACPSPITQREEWQMPAEGAAAMFVASLTGIVEAGFALNSACPTLLQRLLSQLAATPCARAAEAAASEARQAWDAVSMVHRQRLVPGQSRESRLTPGGDISAEQLEELGVCGLEVAPSTAQGRASPLSLRVTALVRNVSEACNPCPECHWAPSFWELLRCSLVGGRGSEGGCVARCLLCASSWQAQLTLARRHGVGGAVGGAEPFSKSHSESLMRVPLLSVSECLARISAERLGALSRMALAQVAPEVFWCLHIFFGLRVEPFLVAESIALVEDNYCPLRLGCATFATLCIAHTAAAARTNDRATALDGKMVSSDVSCSDGRSRLPTASEASADGPAAGGDSAPQQSLAGTLELPAMDCVNGPDSHAGFDADENRITGSTYGELEGVVVLEDVCSEDGPECPGKISLAEFAGSALQLGLSIEEAREFFRGADFDGNGIITEKDLKRFRSNLLPQHVPGELSNCHTSFEQHHSVGCPTISRWRSRKPREAHHAELEGDALSNDNTKGAVAGTQSPWERALQTSRDVGVGSQRIDDTREVGVGSMSVEVEASPSHMSFDAQDIGVSSFGIASLNMSECKFISIQSMTTSCPVAACSSGCDRADEESRFIMSLPSFVAREPVVSPRRTSAMQSDSSPASPASRGTMSLCSVSPLNPPQRLLNQVFVLHCNSNADDVTPLGWDADNDVMEVTTPMAEQLALPKLFILHVELEGCEARSAIGRGPTTRNISSHGHFNSHPRSAPAFAIAREAPKWQGPPEVGAMLSPRDSITLRLGRTTSPFQQPQPEKRSQSVPPRSARRSANPNSSFFAGALAHSERGSRGSKYPRGVPSPASARGVDVPHRVQIQLGASARTDPLPRGNSVGHSTNLTQLSSRALGDDGEQILGASYLVDRREVHSAGPLTTPRRPDPTASTPLACSLSAAPLKSSAYVEKAGSSESATSALERKDSEMETIGRDVIPSVAISTPPSGDCSIIGGAGYASTYQRKFDLELQRSKQLSSDHRRRQQVLEQRTQEQRQWAKTERLLGSKTDVGSFGAGALATTAHSAFEFGSSRLAMVGVTKLAARQNFCQSIVAPVASRSPRGVSQPCGSTPVYEAALTSPFPHLTPRRSNLVGSGVPSVVTSPPSGPTPLALGVVPTTVTAATSSRPPPSSWSDVAGGAEVDDPYVACPVALASHETTAKSKLAFPTHSRGGPHDSESESAKVSDLDAEALLELEILELDCAIGRIARRLSTAAQPTRQVMTPKMVCEKELVAERRPQEFEPSDWECIDRCVSQGMDLVYANTREAHAPHALAQSCGWNRRLPKSSCAHEVAKGGVMGTSPPSVHPDVEGIR